MLRNLAKYIPGVIVFWGFSFLSCNSFAQASEGFLRNNGQEGSSIIARTDLPSGELFIKKSGWEFLSVDNYDLKKLRQDPLLNHSFNARLISVELIDPSLGGLINFQGKQNTPYYFLNAGATTVTTHPYSRIQVEGVSQGLDLEYEYYHNSLKTSIVLDPFSDTKRAKFLIKGAPEKYLDAEGKLIIQNELGTIEFEVPVGYQQFKNGSKNNILTGFEMVGDTIQYVFLQRFEGGAQLIIDQVINFIPHGQHYLNNFSNGVAAVDQDNYLMGNCFNWDLNNLQFGENEIKCGPANTGTPTVDQDIVITEVRHPELLISKTIIRGNESEIPLSLAHNGKNRIAVATITNSTDLPVFANSNQPKLKGSFDYYLFEFELSTHKIISSTYLGGDEDEGFFGDENNQKFTGIPHFNGTIKYLGHEVPVFCGTTRSSNFPGSSDLFGNEGFLVRFEKSFAKFRWFNVFGGKEDEGATDMAIGKDHIFVCGMTSSKNIFNGEHQGGLDGFLLKIDPLSGDLSGSAYFGGKNNDIGYRLTITPGENPLVAGITFSKDFPSVGTIEQGSNFLIGFDNDLQEVSLSKRLTSPGSYFIPSGIHYSPDQIIYFSGWNTTLGLPEVGNGFKDGGSEGDFYLGAWHAETQLFGTYAGDKNVGEYLIGGYTEIKDFGIFNIAFSGGCGSGFITPEPNSAIGENSTFSCREGLMTLKVDLFSPGMEFPSGICEGTDVKFKNTSLQARDFIWDFGDGEQSNLMAPEHHYAKAGLYKVKLTAISFEGETETITGELQVNSFPDPSFSFEADGPAVKFIPSAPNEAEYWWEFGDNTANKRVSPFHVYQEGGTYTVRLRVTSEANCTDSYQTEIKVKKTGLNISDQLETSARVYPNPFRENFTIEFDLEKDEMVDIAVYDLSGKLLKKLASGFHVKGVHQYPVNAVSEGIDRNFLIVRLVLGDKNYLFKIERQ